MLYSTIRQEHAETGDLFVIQGKGIVSRMIRAFTGQSFSHVGVLAFLDENKTCLMVVEMREFRGWQTMRASDWYEDATEDGALVFYVKRPPEATDSIEMFDYLFARRKFKYDYLGLIKIWWSAFRLRSFRKHIDKRTSEVCSTFAAGCWAKGGWQKPDQDFNPGTFLAHGNWTTVVTPEVQVDESALESAAQQKLITEDDMLEETLRLDR